MPRLKIAEILATWPVDPERHLDPERLQYYRRSIDDLDPVVVFQTDEGLLLADGYHRVAAALREGRETIEAEVRSGSRRDALEYATAVGAAQRGITSQEARKRILQWRDLP
jgi:ParB-like chromosome segregation protein Spo0J